MKSTLNTVLISFGLIAVLFLSYLISLPGESGALEKKEFKDQLSRPALKLPIIQADSSSAFYYLQKNNFFPAPEINSESVLVKSVEEDKNFFSLNPSQKRPVASITKILTSLVVLDFLDPDALVKVSQSAVNNEGDAGGLHPGEVISVEALLNAILLESSNDAALALAEIISSNKEVEKGSSVDKFVGLMNSKAKSIGMNSSLFSDPAGLEDEESYSTAEDLYVLLKYLREKDQYDLVWDILQKESAVFKAVNADLIHTFHNNNPFITQLKDTVGGKTGYTNKAKESMVLVVKSPDKESEIIYIVLGSSDRFKDIKNLINWVNNAYIWEK